MVKCILKYGAHARKVEASCLEDIHRAVELEFGSELQGVEYLLKYFDREVMEDIDLTERMDLFNIRVTATKSRRSKLGHITPQRFVCQYI